MGCQKCSTSGRAPLQLCHPERCASRARLRGAVTLWPSSCDKACAQPAPSTTGRSAGRTQGFSDPEGKGRGTLPRGLGSRPGPGAAAEPGPPSAGSRAAEAPPLAAGRPPPRRSASSRKQNRTVGNELNVQSPLSGKGPLRADLPRPAQASALSRRQPDTSAETGSGTNRGSSEAGAGAPKPSPPLNFPFPSVPAVFGPRPQRCRQSPTACSPRHHPAPRPRSDTKGRGGGGDGRPRAQLAWNSASWGPLLLRPGDAGRGSGQTSQAQTVAGAFLIRWLRTWWKFFQTLRWKRSESPRKTFPDL